MHPRPDHELYRLRLINRYLHATFAETMAAVDAGEPPPPDAAATARRLATLPNDIESDKFRPEQIPLGRPGARTLLRQALKPGSAALRVTIRAGIAVLIAGSIAAVLTIDHSYWAMAAAVLMLHQNFGWIRTITRGIERMIGTLFGLGVAGIILAPHPQGLWLVLVIATLQFLIEMYVVRNYTLAVVFITPAALLIAAGGLPVDDLPELLVARGADTVIGCAVALLVFWVTLNRQTSNGLVDAISGTREAVDSTLPYLLAGTVNSPEAWAARRDLQLRAMALLPAYDSSIGGSPQQRAAAEDDWPTVVATEQLAYRTLAACWALERDGDRQVAADTAAALREALDD